MERHTARMIVAGFIEKDGKILTILERPSTLAADAPPVMNHPAGHVEENETLTDAVIREVLEESGYHVRPVELVGIHQVIRKDENRTAICFLFACELLDEKQTAIEAPEIVETHWLTKEEILSRSDEHRSKNTTKRFQHYFSGNRYPLETIEEFFA